MRIKVRNFGIARDLCGGPLTELELPDGATAADLRDALGERFPGLLRLKSFLLAVNEAYSEPSDVLAEGDDVAVIPPVSGG